MEYSIIVLKQIIVMFLLMSVGYGLYKTKMMDSKGSSQISTILMKVVMPMVIIQSFQRTFVAKEAIDWIIVFVISIISIVAGIIVSRLVFNKDQTIEQCAVGLSNAGFMGIPLVQAMLGPEYVFYVSAYLVGYNLMGWTLCVMLMTNDKKHVSAKKILFNPATVGLFFGAIIYLLPESIEIPGVISSTFASLASLNTPLAMLVLGSYIAKEPLFKIFSSLTPYLVALFRLVVVPLAIIIVLKFIPLSNEIKFVLLLVTSAPSGVMVAMFAQIFDKNYEHAARIVSVTTLLCVFTIPLLIMLANFVW